MNKNGKYLNFIFASEAKKKENNNINNPDFIKKLSSTKQKISSINFSDVGLKNSNFIGFNSFKNKKEKIKKSNNNSKIKQNKKNLITSLNETDEKNENINDEIILKYQYYKYLSNKNNSKEKNNLKKKYIYGTKLKNNNSNIKKNEIINYDDNKSKDFDKKKVINKKFIKKTGEKIEKNENNHQKNNRYNKINSNLENKIELFLSGKIKNNLISREDLLSLFNNNNSIKNKNSNNKNSINYTSTNPNNKNETDYIASFNKNLEKSCPKFNFNQYASYRQGQNNINIKKFNYDQINENNDDFYKLEKNIYFKKLKENNISNYTLADHSNYTNNKKNSYLDNNKNRRIKSSKKNDYNQNIIEFFLPNKTKQNSNNIKEYNQGSLQKIINRNEDKNNSNQKLNTQTNLNNKNEIKNTNKFIGVKKIRTVHEKNNNNKKDITFHNMALKKKRPRYFDSEINSNIIDSTNILKKIKNKNTYLNIIRKAFNNKNNPQNYYNNYMSNNNYENKSQRDSKSVNILRNNSNTNINVDKNNKKKKYENEYYINKLINLNGDKNNARNYSQNKGEGFYDRKNSFENNVINDNEINNDKIIENISNNSLNTYSIFISHKYYREAKRIALKQIKLFDFYNNEIPVIFYRTNADFNNGRLFNTTIKYLESNKKGNFRDEIINNNIPFLSDIKKDVYIYFYLNNEKSAIIKYIQIENYSNKLSKNISPVKNVEMYKGQNLIYKGMLMNNINTIEINSTIQKNNRIDINKERPLSSSKQRKEISIKNSVLTKPEFSTYTKNKPNSREIYYSARNNLFKQFNMHANIKEEDEYNEKNINLLQKSEKFNNDNINGTNTINIHINNNTNNVTNLEIFEKNLKPEKKNKNNSFFFTMQNEEKMKNNDNILIKSVNQNLDMSFGRIYSEENDNYNETIFKKNENTFNYNKSQNKPEIKEIDYFERYSINDNTYNGNLPINSINYNFNNNSNLYNTKINNNYNNYIQFNKIKFVLQSNYGHKKHVGLTGIEFYNMKGDLINIESAVSIGALPKDLRTIYDDENDLRIFENVFNGFNNTDDIENMWVTKLKKFEPKSFIELYFKEKIKVSKLKIYNYNEKNNLEIGVKTMNLYLDDNFYGTIYLKPGIGEIAYDYINLKEEKSIDSEDGYNNEEKDFGEIITFPLKNEVLNNKLNDSNNNIKIKYASVLYEQNYETPFMPTGNYIKFEFLSNYYKGFPINDEEQLFKYKDIGLDSLEIYNEENKNIITGKSDYKYKIISNCEIFHNKKNKLILNGAQNKNGNNCLFYIFEKPVSISYIKFNPLSKNMKSLLNSVKEIKVFCDNNIIFEGELYIEHPTLVLFSGDMEIIKGINEKYLTKKINTREVKEIKNNKYFSLIMT